MISSDVRSRFDRPVLAAVLGITALALIARLILLGDRVAHYDEARVAYGTLRYLKTGAWQYNPTRHGPFLFHVNRVVFAILGPSDVTARLVVAVVGGSLPLTAWLFRDRLRSAQVVALSVLFAIDPILLYYSRFMRNDLLVATFSIAGLGLFVRFLDTRKSRYLYAGTTSFALAFTAKENAILYPVSILAGVVLLFDHRLFLARARDEDWLGYAIDRITATAVGAWRFKGQLLFSALLFVVVFAFAYAPRLAPVGGPGLWHAIAHPSRLPRVLEIATLGTIDEIRSIWLGGPFQNHAYKPFLGFYVEQLVRASGPIVALAVVGFVADRYGGARPNDLVSLGFYWGVASVLGYPAAMSVQGAWAVTHAIVPLAFPAAAGGALVYRWGREASETGDRVGVTIAAVVLLLAGGYMAGMAVHTSYLSPQDNRLVQYAQPEDDMHPALSAAQDAARDTEGLDVLWVGEHFYVENEAAASRLGVPDGEWYNRLPVPWYLEIANATIDSVRDVEATDGIANLPPVVITCTAGVGCPGDSERADLNARLAGYERFPPYEARYLPNGEAVQFVFYVDERYVAD